MNVFVWVSVTVPPLVVVLKLVSVLVVVALNNVPVVVVPVCVSEVELLASDKLVE